MKQLPVLRVFMSLAALFLGLCILIISLFTTSKTVEFRLNLSTHAQRPIKELFTSTILPGTPLYPFSVVKDWTQLFFAGSDQKKLQYMIAFGDKRLSNAVRMLEANYNDFVPTSASKGELYLGRALEICRKNSQYQECELLNSTLKKHEEILLSMKSKLTDVQKSQIDALIEYNRSTQITLSGFLSH